KRAARESLASLGNGQNRSFAAYALAVCGETAAAEKLGDALLKEKPLDSLVRSVDVPVIRAASRISRNEPAAAVTLLEDARRYESGMTPGTLSSDVQWVRARAYLEMKDGDKAIAEFQKVLDGRNRRVLTGQVQLAQLGLARAYALKGDSGKARTAYQD